MRSRLFDAAACVVGEFGYAETSVARIVDLAGVAQGTFYNHFASRQALFDELLPVLGLEMAHFIQTRTREIRPEVEREIARFRAFFDYLRINPGFHRILNEAEFAAPIAYQQHIENMAEPYQKMLRHARDQGELGSYNDAEIEVMVHILMGARSYLSQRMGATTDDALFDTYAKLLRDGLFRK
jgi:AcrR family transcriptional regulator